MVPGYLAAMVRRVPPAGAPVAVGSTPVVSFGDPRRAVVATLGINPSVAEFTEHAHMLVGRQRRLATLASLRAQRCDLLNESQIAQVIADCASYFGRQPYLRWFQPWMPCSGLAWRELLRRLRLPSGPSSVGDQPSLESDSRPDDSSGPT